jgi:hypothetical protein
MNASPPESSLLGLSPTRPDTLALQWSALRSAAGAVADLAGHHAQLAAATDLAFPTRLQTLPPTRRAMIEQAIGDLVAVMEPGVAALLSVHESGADATPAARALWQEFVAAREGIFALVPPPAE